MMCERCWRDAYPYNGYGCESQVERYNQLVNERNCTPEQQAGEYWVNGKDTRYDKK